MCFMELTSGEHGNPKNGEKRNSAKCVSKGVVVNNLSSYFKEYNTAGSLLYYSK